MTFPCQLHPPNALLLPWHPVALVLLILRFGSGIERLSGGSGIFLSSIPFDSCLQNCLWQGRLTMLPSLICNLWSLLEYGADSFPLASPPRLLFRAWIKPRALCMPGKRSPTEQDPLHLTIWATFSQRTVLEWSTKAKITMIHHSPRLGFSCCWRKSAHAITLEWTLASR